MNRIKQRNVQIILLFLILIIGTAAGSLLRARCPEWTIWNNMTFRQGMGIITEYRFYCIAAPLFWLAVTAILGLSAAGLPIVPCVLFLRGMAFGSLLETLYSTQSSISDIGKTLLLILPYAYGTSFVMLFGAREALRFSIQITGLLCDKTQEEEVSVKLYIIRFFVLFGFLLLFGFVQNFLLKKFS